jgi:hypothetical protein
MIPCQARRCSSVASVPSHPVYTPPRDHGVRKEPQLERGSDSSFLANHMRLFYACGAYVLMLALRTETLRGTEFAKAQPSTLMNQLFKIASKVVRYKDRILLHLPTTCTVQHVLKKVTEILYLVPPVVRTG